MKTILKILFFPVTFPYYILKWLGGSSSSTTDTKGNINIENKVLPTVTIEPNKATEFQILEVKWNGSEKSIRVKYKENSRNSSQEVIVDRPSKKNGPLQINWS